MLISEIMGLDGLIIVTPVAITFFIGYMAMFGFAVFFFAEGCGGLNGKSFGSRVNYRNPRRSYLLHGDFYLSRLDLATSFPVCRWTPPLSPLYVREF